MNNLKWLVCYDIQQERKIIAAFAMYIHAEDFIKYSLPEDNKEKFYIVNVETGKTTRD